MLLLFYNLKAKIRSKHDYVFFLKRNKQNNLVEYVLHSKVMSERDREDKVVCITVAVVHTLRKVLSVCSTGLVTIFTDIQ